MRSKKAKSSKRYAKKQAQTTKPSSSIRQGRPTQIIDQDQWKREDHTAIPEAQEGYCFIRRLGGGKIWIPTPPD
jgi:hypothetical protein